MAKPSEKNSVYRHTESGSIDFQFYEQRARSLRSKAAWELAKRLFYGKQFSSEEDLSGCLSR